MNAEFEEKLIISEWKQRALDDLQSAEILLRENGNYEIVAYHAHQAVEKAFKTIILMGGKKFGFTHDLSKLLCDAGEIALTQEIQDGILSLNSIYPFLRYPSGEHISKEQAQGSVATARQAINILLRENK